MAKETRPQTYRVSDEVDAELRRLAKTYGGIDKGLRFLLGNATAFTAAGISKAGSQHGIRGATESDYHVEYDEGQQ